MPLIMMQDEVRVFSSVCSSVLSLSLSIPGAVCSCKACNLILDGKVFASDLSRPQRTMSQRRIFHALTLIACAERKDLPAQGSGRGVQ